MLVAGTIFGRAGAGALLLCWCAPCCLMGAPRPVHELPHAIACTDMQCMNCQCTPGAAQHGFHAQPDKRRQLEHCVPQAGAMQRALRRAQQLGCLQALAVSGEAVCAVACVGDRCHRSDAAPLQQANGGQGNSQAIYMMASGVCLDKTAGKVHACRNAAADAPWIAGAAAGNALASTQRSAAASLQRCAVLDSRPSGSVQDALLRTCPAAPAHGSLACGLHNTNACLPPASQTGPQWRWWCHPWASLCPKEPWPAS
jgi:hypothetical protein